MDSPLHRRVTFILIIISTYCCSAQEAPWMLLETAKAAYEDRDTARSLELLLAVVDEMDEYPEAEYWLGRVYAAQGQAVLAEEQYRRALQLSIYLRVPEDRYLVSYSLAELLLTMSDNRRKEAEAILMEIANSEGASDPMEIELEHRYIEALIADGLDELLYLYRAELRYSLQSRRMLGEIAWEDGRYRSSLLHSVRTVLSLLSTAADRYRNTNQNWRFDIDLIEDAKFPDRDVRYTNDTDGVLDLLKRIEEEYSPLLQWMEDSGFWHQIYLMSVSLYAEGYMAQADSLWQFLASSSFERTGRWRTLAEHQLNQPFITTGSLSP